MSRRSASRIVTRTLSTRRVEKPFALLKLENLRKRSDGRGDWIRTSDPLYPKQVRYQAAPLPDTFNFVLAPVGPAGFEPAT